MMAFASNVKACYTVSPGIACLIMTTNAEYAYVLFTGMRWNDACEVLRHILNDQCTLARTHIMSHERIPWVMQGLLVSQTD